ncbi:hypothetical protein G6F58_013352 [Rhizopus delemar]|nr:hypothetical protein G6F58_013352 [Rhizopus delemar]
MVRTGPRLATWTWPLTIRPPREAVAAVGTEAGAGAGAGAATAGVAALAATATGLRSMLATVVAGAGFGAVTTGRGAGRVSRL